MTLPTKASLVINGLMHLMMRRNISIAATALVGALAGCGDSGTELGTVTGTVTLDGRPLADAQVEFQPAIGAPSRGRTDKQGWYQISYTRDLQGALVGPHTIRITTFRRTTNARDRAETVHEQLPTRYHTKTTLTAEVKPGSNVVDFDLAL